MLYSVLHRRKSSSGNEGSSSDEEKDEDRIGDMGLFGTKLAQFKQLQAERQSPKSEEKLLHKTSPKNTIEFDINMSPYVFTKEDFVEGQRLVDPVTGRTEPPAEESSFAELERTSLAQKRSKTEEA